MDYLASYVATFYMDYVDKLRNRWLGCYASTLRSMNTDTGHGYVMDMGTRQT